MGAFERSRAGGCSFVKLKDATQAALLYLLSSSPGRRFSIYLFQCGGRTRRFVSCFGGFGGMSFRIIKAVSRLVSSTSIFMSYVASTQKLLIRRRQLFGPNILIIPIRAQNFRGYSLFFSGIFTSSARRIGKFGGFSGFRSFGRVSGILLNGYLNERGSTRHVLSCGVKLKLRSIFFTSRVCSVMGASVWEWGRNN